MMNGIKTVSYSFDYNSDDIVLIYRDVSYRDDTGM